MVYTSKKEWKELSTKFKMISLSKKICIITIKKDLKMVNNVFNE